MKKLILLTLTLITSFVASSCSSNDNGVSSTVDTLVINNKDSLIITHKDSITNHDTLYISKTITHTDSIYNLMLDSIKTKYYTNLDSLALMDSIKNRAASILDSNELNQLSDSIYFKIYNQVKEDLSSSATEDIEIIYENHMDEIKTAYLPYIETMYKNHPYNAYVYYAIIKNYSYKYTYYLNTEVSILGYSYTTNRTITLKPGKQDTIRITPQLIYFKLDSIREVANTQIEVNITSILNNTEATFYSNSFPTKLTAVDVASLSFSYYPDGDTIWYRDYLPIWSTPNIPEIQTILHRASELNENGNLKGYQGDIDTARIKKEVESVYNALQELGINYVDNIISYTNGQKIKFPKDVLTTKNANCIDGAMLYVAIFEAMGLNPVVVDIPGHAFVGWETWDGSGKYEYLETTLTWGTSSFSYANSRGNEEYNEEIDNGNFANGDSHILNIKQLREEYNITPIVLAKKR